MSSPAAGGDLTSPLGAPQAPFALARFALAQLEGLGGFLLAALGPLLLSTALLLALAYLLDQVLQRRVSAGLRILLYLPVALRLALPPSWATPLGLLEGGAGLVEVGGGAVVVAAATLGVTEGGAGLGARALFAAGYLGVVAWLLLRWRASARGLARALGEATPGAVGGYSGPIWIHPRLGPAVIGVRQPRVVVPRWLVEGEEDAARRGSLSLVLRHELAHVQRRDPLLAAAVHAACVLAWPLLPVWLAARRVRALVEQACDERAVGHEGLAVRRHYGEILLAVARSRPTLPGPALAPSFGSPLAGRLRALARRRRWPLVVQTALVVAAAGLFLACAGRAEDDGALLEEPSLRRELSAPPAAAPTGSYRDASRRVFSAKNPTVKACYDAEMAIQAVPGGRLVVEFLIQRSGEVDRASLVESTLGRPRLENCVLAEARRWTFPSHGNEGGLVMRFPFLFVPAGTPPYRILGRDH